MNFIFLNKGIGFTLSSVQEKLIIYNTSNLKKIISGFIFLLSEIYLQKHIIYRAINQAKVSNNEENMIPNQASQSYKKPHQ